jgi:heme-degrading monooxygenase HmoA
MSTFNNDKTIGHDMSIYATNTFLTQPGRADELISTLKSVLADTLRHGGCESITLLHDQDDPNSVVSLTQWATREHYEAYLEWRDDRGDTATFRAMLVKPMEVHYYDSAFAVTA